MTKKNGLKLALLLSLATGAKAYGMVAAEVPLANTDIGNQAYVSYYTEGNLQKFLQSNIVITRINAAYNLDLTPNRTVALTRGTTAMFNHVLTNTGNIIDSYDLTHTYGPSAGRDVKIYLDQNNNGMIDNGEAEIPYLNSKYQIKNIEPGQAVSLLVSVPTTTNDTAATLTGQISSKSVGNSSLPIKTVTETITFQEGGNAIVYKAINKSSGTSEIENEIIVYLKIANESTKAEDIATEFSLTDKLDPRFNYVPGSAKFKNFNGIDTVLTDRDDTEINNNSTPIKFKYENGEIKFDILNGVPANNPLNSQNGILEFKVKVPANTPVGMVPNYVDYKYKPTGALNSIDAASNKVNYEILKYVRATFEGMHIPVGQAGETLRFENKLTNTANAAERFSLKLSDEFFPAGTTFRLAMESIEDEGHVERPVIDTNGDGNIDTGLVYPGLENHVNVILYATLPTNMPEPGSNYKIVKNATSAYNPDYVVRANDTLGTIKIATVDITNNQSISENANAEGVGLGPERNPVNQKTVNPGSVANFVLHINNTSKYVEEQYSLEVSTKPDFSDMTIPAGIVVRFKQGGGAEVTKTAKIGPDRSQRIDAEVTVSPTAGAMIVPLYFRATSLTTGSRDIKYDSLAVNPIRSVQIIPNLTGETYAGGNIVYTHKVRNNGNVLEGDGKVSSLILETKESLSQWRTELFIDSNKNGIFETGIDVPFVDFATVGGLKPAEEVTIFARVLAPMGAPAGVINKTTITPKLTQGTYSMTPTVTSAYDDTKILAEKLSIRKLQKIRGKVVDGKLDAWKTALQDANPKDVIDYRIEVRNTGSDNANMIQLKDSIPFYTTIIHGGAYGVPKWEVLNSSNVVMLSGFIKNLPASGTRGDLVVDVNSLDANHMLVLEFSVQINGKATESNETK
ncbi:MAG: hypothetical protein ACRCZ1_02135 [Cetobacterium sp.]